MDVESTRSLFASWLDCNYYKDKYADLRSLTDEQLQSHFIVDGFKEGRINSQRHKEYVLQNLDFPFYHEFYKENEDIKNTEVIMPFPDLMAEKEQDKTCLDRTLVIYAFHQYNNYVKMFINRCIFDDKNTDFIIVANIPSLDFSTIPGIPSYVKTYTRENVGWDNGAYSYALLIDDNYKKYKSFILLNSTVMGPYIPSYYPKNWTNIFTDALVDNIHCFGTMINTEKDPLNKAHVQSCCFSLTNEAANLLIDAEIFSNDPNSQYSTHHETIMYKEILMSRMIIARGWNIGCLFPGFRGIDFRFKTKRPEDYRAQAKYLFAGDMMYPKFRYTVWDPYQLVFYKGNRFI